MNTHPESTSLGGTGLDSLESLPLKKLQTLLIQALKDDGAPNVTARAVALTFKRPSHIIHFLQVTRLELPSGYEKPPSGCL